MLQPRHHPLVRGKPEIWSVPSVHSRPDAVTRLSVFVFLSLFLLGEGLSLSYRVLLSGRGWRAHSCSAEQ